MSVRFARDVTISVLAAGIGTLAFSGWTTQPDVAAPRPETKQADRLSFIQEDVPVRETRIYDTLAMFSTPSAEPGTWSDKPVPALKVAEAPARPAARTGTPPMPRMVSADLRAPQHPTILPPARPIQLAAAPLPVAALVPAPPRTPATTGAAATREPVRVFGWSVPGTQVLPTKRDATKAVEFVGDTAAQIGNGTVEVAGSAASKIGRTVSSFGDTVAETVGLR